MTLAQIIPLLIAGQNVRRNEWRHDSRYLFTMISATDAETVTVLYRDGTVTRYNISNKDAWADDWEALP